MVWGLGNARPLALEVCSGNMNPHHRVLWRWVGLESKDGRNTQPLVENRYPLPAPGDQRKVGSLEDLPAVRGTPEGQGLLRDLFPGERAGGQYLPSLLSARRFMKSQELQMPRHLRLQRSPEASPCSARPANQQWNRTLLPGMQRETLPAFSTLFAGEQPAKAALGVPSSRQSPLPLAWTPPMAAAGTENSSARSNSSRASPRIVPIHVIS